MHASSDQLSSQISLLIPLSYSIYRPKYPRKAFCCKDALCALHLFHLFIFFCTFQVHPCALQG